MASRNTSITTKWVLPLVVISSMAILPIWLLMPETEKPDPMGRDFALRTDWTTARDGLANEVDLPKTSLRNVPANVATPIPSASTGR